MKRLAMLGWFAALVLFVSLGALAKPSFKDKSQALQLANKAAFLAKIGKHEEAVEKLREADRLDPQPSYKVRLAQSLVKLDKLREASEIVDAAAQENPPTMREKLAVRNAKKLGEEIKVITPTLTVALVDPPAASGKASLTLDGEPFDPSVGPYPLDPGTHEVVAKAEGYEQQAFEVTLAQKGQETLRISLTPLPAPVPTEEEEEEGGGMGKWPAIVAWAVGGVGLGFGVGFGIVAMDQTNALYEDFDCQDNRCPEEARDELDTSLMNGNISTAGFVVAGAGLVLGTVLWLVSDASEDEADEPADEEAPSDEEEARGLEVWPLLGAGYAGVVGAF